MEVDRSEVWDAGSPRSAPFPMAAIPIASGDGVIAAAAAKQGIQVIPDPQARNSIAGYQGQDPVVQDSSNT